jgi:hypothetical protein
MAKQFGELTAVEVASLYDTIATWFKGQDIDDGVAQAIFSVVDSQYQESAKALRNAAFQSYLRGKFPDVPAEPEL